MNQLFASAGQSIGVLASASVLTMNIQDWCSLGSTGLISLQSKGLSRLLQYYSSKASILLCLAFFMVQLLHPYVTTRKTIACTMQTFFGNVTSLLFYTTSRFVIALLPKCKRLLISWRQSLSAVVLEPKKKQSMSLFPLFPHLFAMNWWDQMLRSLYLECWVLS